MYCVYLIATYVLRILPNTPSKLKHSKQALRFAGLRGALNRPDLQS